MCALYPSHSVGGLPSDFKPRFDKEPAEARAYIKI